MAVDTVSFLVKVNTGTAELPVWTAVGSQRDAKLNRDMGTVDVSTKSSGGWEESMAGNRSWSIEANALYVPDDTAYEALEDAWDARSTVHVQVEEANGDTYDGDAYITSFPKSFPNSPEAVTIDVTFKGTGALTRTEAT